MKCLSTPDIKLKNVKFSCQEEKFINFGSCFIEQFTNLIANKFVLCEKYYHFDGKFTGPQVV